MMKTAVCRRTGSHGSHGACPGVDFPTDYDGTPAAVGNSRGFSYPASWRSEQGPQSPSAAELAAFADAVQDYAETYAAEEQGSEADRSWRRRSLLLEGAELFRAAGLELAA